MENLLRILLLSGVLLGSGLCFSTAWAGGPGEDLDRLSSSQIVQRALVDTLYYDYEKWFSLIGKKISRLSSRPHSTATQLELMKYHFYLAGLYTELSHTLAFTSRFKVKTIENGFSSNIHKAKSIAQELLEHPDLDRRQRAEVFLYLGAAEGYLGIFDYGGGHLLQALVNGFQADNHLEKALKLDSQLVDAHLGLGIYRYGNSRLGGIGNFLMQGGRDLRRIGLQHLELAVRSRSVSFPLALKTLIWFYISEQINPRNAGLPPNDPMSAGICRERTLQLMRTFEENFFKKPPDPAFIGNKDLAMMKAIQSVLDADYTRAREEFKKIVTITRYLKNTKGYQVNPQLVDTAEAGVKFSEVMMQKRLKSRSPPSPSTCIKINRQLDFMKNGGSLVEYDSKKIRKEIQDVFYQRLLDLSRKLSC